MKAKQTTKPEATATANEQQNANKQQPTLTPSIDKLAAMTTANFMDVSGKERDYAQCH